MKEVIFNKNSFPILTNSLIKEIKELSIKAPKLRARFCLHMSHDDPIQEMVIATRKESYNRPHRHPIGRTKSYHIIEGQMDVLVFSDTGEVIERFSLGNNTSNDGLLCRICGNFWHMPVAQSRVVVFHEVLMGPFEKENTAEYAPWAPAEEESRAEIQKWLDHTLKVFPVSE
jgi:cupin fold WbuC family metalloprotein